MAIDLITLDEYKEAEAIVSSKEDTRIELLIPSISQLVKTYCGNSLVDHYNAATPKIEVLDIMWDTSIVQLTESPIVQIVTVEERSSFNSTYSTLSSTDYFLSESTDSLHRIKGNGYGSWTEGPGSVKVTYRAGYSETPLDLKLAIVDLITYYLRDEHKNRQAIASASIENAGTTSIRGDIGFPDHIKRVLDLYKTY